MSIFFTFLIIFGSASISAWNPEIDINRVRLLSKEHPSHKHLKNLHTRRSILPNHRDDYDHHSSRLSHPRSEKPLPTSSTSETKVYQPREDPRNFYLSDTYAKEILANRLSNEVAQVYPGQDDVRATDYYYRRPLARLKERKTNQVPHGDPCVTCPRDRTLIAKPGYDRVLLQKPRLSSCSGYRVTNDVKFIPTYGPRFGTVLKKGSYKILGQIKRRNHIIKHCQMSVDVLIQSCALPKYLKAECGAENNTCRFECRSPKDELQGPASLSCGDNFEWSGHLPTCSARNWCKPQSPPPHGRISCKGDTVNGWGLVEGTKCRIKCARGWKPNARSFSMCRKGSWTQEFSCSRF